MIGKIETISNDSSFNIEGYMNYYIIEWSKPFIFSYYKEYVVRI